MRLHHSDHVICLFIALIFITTFSRSFIGRWPQRTLELLTGSVNPYLLGLHSSQSLSQYLDGYRGIETQRSADFQVQHREASPPNFAGIEKSDTIHFVCAKAHCGLQVPR
jgi:hypothetical protein